MLIRDTLAKIKYPPNPRYLEMVKTGTHKINDSSLRTPPYLFLGCLSYHWGSECLFPHGGVDVFSFLLVIVFLIF